VSVERRLRRLEEQSGSLHKPCERCSYIPGQHIEGRVEYEIHWPDVPELSDIEDPGPELCLACGRRLVFSVDFPMEVFLWRGEGVLS
jgi:hypothetical protein